MIINGYKVEWEEVGWSFIRPCVKKREKFLFIPYWKTVWHGTKSIHKWDEPDLAGNGTQKMFEVAFSEYEQSEKLGLKRED